MYKHKKLISLILLSFIVSLNAEIEEIVTTGSHNVIVGMQADVDSSNTSAQNQIVIGYNADGIGDNKAVIGNTSVTDVYMAQDGEAIVHAASISFSDGTSQTTAASASVPSTISSLSLY